MLQVFDGSKDMERAKQLHNSRTAKARKMAIRKDRWAILLAKAYELDKGHASGTKLSPEVLRLCNLEKKHTPKKGEKTAFQQALILIEVAEKKRAKLRMH